MLVFFKVTSAECIKPSCGQHVLYHIVYLGPIMSCTHVSTSHAINFKENLLITSYLMYILEQTRSCRQGICKTGELGILWKKCPGFPAYFHPLTTSEIYDPYMDGCGLNSTTYMSNPHELPHIYRKLPQLKDSNFTKFEKV